MPYADPEKRRQFQREYKRKWRKKKEIINPLRGFRVYVCTKFPDLWMRREKFVFGLLVTNNPETQAEVEAHRDFAKLIFPLAIDFTCGPAEDEDE